MPPNPNEGEVTTGAAPTGTNESEITPGTSVSEEVPGNGDNNGGNGNIVNGDNDSVVGGNGAANIDPEAVTENKNDDHGSAPDDPLPTGIAITLVPFSVSMALLIVSSKSKKK